MLSAFGRTIRRQTQDCLGKATAIPEGLFLGCTALAEVKLPEGLTEIGVRAFKDCPLTSIALPGDVTTIRDSAFQNCSLTAVTLPEGVTTIGASAFEDCASLASVSFPAGMNAVGASAFKNCSALTSVKFARTTNAFTLGFNIRTDGSGTEASQEYEAQFEIQPVRGLLINGNFGYRENRMSNTNFVGDFDAQLLLNQSGNIRLKAYNQTNDRYFVRTNPTTQGLGIIFKKDFDNWNELFFWRSKKKKSETETTKPVEDEETKNDTGFVRFREKQDN